MSDWEYISDEVDFKPCEATPLPPPDFNEQQEVSGQQLLNLRPPPKKTAWSKGPQGSATMPSPRSHPSIPVTLTRSRRSSTLGQVAPLNDGDSVSKLNLSAYKQSGLLPSHF